MSETIQCFHGLKAVRRWERAHFGVPCPECVRLLPRAQPSILLPKHRCRIHGYRDPRPDITQSDIDAMVAAKGGPS